MRRCVALWFSMRAPFRPSTSDFSSLMHAGYLRVSGPLHLRVVIQVFLSPCMVEMRAYTDCTPSFTSLAEDENVHVKIKRSITIHGHFSFQNVGLLTFHIAATMLSEEWGPVPFGRLNGTLNQ